MKLSISYPLNKEKVVTLANNNINDRISEDEIDLKELFITLWNKKLFILILTSIITLISIFYVVMKNPKPIYSGSLLVEVGEYYGDSFGTQHFDNPKNLKIILENEFSSKIIIPRRTNNLINIQITDENKEVIIGKIKEIKLFVLKRHENKSKLYDKFIMTKEIGNISISNKAINTPKKKLIIVVAFVTGFILSIFLVFLMNFIQGFKEEKINSNI